MGKKRIWGIALLTIFVNILCLPLWTECGYSGFIQSLFNKEARLDLLYSGQITMNEPLSIKVTPNPFFATWVYESGSSIHRINQSLRTRGNWQKLSLQLKALRDGKITILFRGPDVHDEYGTSYSILIDWRNVKINGKTILTKRGAFSFIKPFANRLWVKKGDVLHIEAEFRRHHFSIHDFTQLKSGMVWYVITGNLMFFFLTCRLLSCVRGGGIRRFDALFLAIFFPILFIPMIGISDAVKSERQNRMLTVKPKLKGLFKERADYGRRYENWFNDHFCGRIALTKLHDTIRNQLSRVIRAQKAVYFKKDSWLFELPLVVDMDNSPTFYQSIVRNLIQLNQFCQRNKIKLYVLEVPRKENIYEEFLKKEYGFDEKKSLQVSQAHEFIRNETEKHHIRYIYPCKALLDAAKSDFVFFKWTNHWTDWGAFVGYCELMKEISKEFPDMPVVSLNDFQKSQNWLIRDLYDESFAFTWRHLYWFLNYRDVFDSPNRAFYSYYDHNNRAKMAFKVGRYIKEFSYTEGRRRVMLIGTSQNENLNHFLPYSASQTKYIRLNMGQAKTADEFKILKLYKKDILAFKPDIHILSISTDNLPRLRDLCSTK